MNQPTTVLDLFRYMIPIVGVFLILYGDRILNIVERWVIARNPLPPGVAQPQPRRRRLRDYLMSYEFWIAGVLASLLSLFVRCEWFKW